MCASNFIATLFYSNMTVSLCIRQGSKRYDDSVSVEELDWSAERQVLIPAEHLWCDFKCRPSAKNSSFLFDPCLIHRGTVMCTFGNIVYIYIYAWKRLAFLFQHFQSSSPTHLFGCKTRDTCGRSQPPVPSDDPSYHRGLRPPLKRSYHRRSRSGDPSYAPEVRLSIQRYTSTLHVTYGSNSSQSPAHRTENKNKRSL